MRVPGTKIYRAFEELDRFSDEQCKRFLVASLRPMRRTLRWVVSGGIGTVIVGCGYFGALWAIEKIPLRNDGPDQVMSWLILLGMTLTTVTAGVFGAALLRDFSLRRRLRKLMSESGSCRGCRYGLLGLTMSAENTVVCPECGHESVVDAAFGELTAEGGGSRTFRAEHRVVERVYWTPQRWRVLTRWSMGIGACAGVVLVIAGAAVWWWLALVAADAARAQAMLAPSGPIGGYYARLEAENKNRLPSSVRDEMMRTGEIISKISREVSQEFTQRTAVASPTMMVYPGSVFRGSGVGPSNPNAAEQAAFDATVADEGFRRVREAGIWDHVEEFTNKILNADPVSDNESTGPSLPIDSVYPYFQSHRTMSTIRLNRAVQSGDAAEAERALRTLFAIGRVDQTEFAFRFPREEIERLEAVMRGLPIADDAMLRRLSALLPEDDLLFASSSSLEHAGMWYHQNICRQFADAQRMRWGVWGFPSSFTGIGPSVKQWLNADPVGRLDENLAAMNGMAADAKQLAMLKPGARAAAAAKLPGPPRLFLMQFYPRAGIYDGLMEQEDRVNVLRLGVKMLIAIERFQRASGSYPLDLNELVPEYVNAVALEPWSNVPFVYRRIQPVVQGGRGFALYSVGANGIDDGGQTSGLVVGSSPARTADDVVFSAP